jgi:hypothetical protein
MTNTTPNYILFLFVVISLILLLIIVNWIWEKINGSKQIEGYENPQYTYLPSKKTPNLYIEFGISDLAVDISYACDFIKIDNKLTGTSRAKIKADESTQSATTPPTENDYTVPYTDLQIYKMYNSASGFSTSSNANIYKKMDLIYGDLFDTTKIGKLSEENIASMWKTNKSILLDDSIYITLNYFVIQSKMANRNSDKGISSYFLKQIQQNKGTPSILTALKNAFYAIIKPRFLANTLSDIYWKNTKTITNNDKGTYNSIVFILNTYASLANTNTLSNDLSEENVAKIVASDTPFTNDALWIYQLGSIAFELFRFTAEFQKNGTSTSGDGKTAINTTAGSFISGYPIYLKKSTQVEPTSPILFFLENLPNNSECPSVNNIQNILSNN